MYNSTVNSFLPADMTEPCGWFAEHFLQNEKVIVT